MLNKLFKKNKPSRLIDSVRIAEPCDVPFTSMTGGERIRHCAACKKNVYNISALSEDEAENLLRSRAEDLCINVYKRTDGTIIFDNCPVALRKVRARMAKVAAILLLAIGLSCLAQRIEAQGLIGAPVSGRFGQSAETDWEPGPDNSFIVQGSLISFALSALIGLFRVRKARKTALVWFRRGASREVVKMLVRSRVIQAISISVVVPIVYFLTCLALRLYWQQAQL